MKNEVTLIGMLKELNEVRKQDPKEFYGSIAFVVLLFGGFYVAIWAEAILSGRV
jgi:hypothetical protein